MLKVEINGKKGIVSVQGEGTLSELIVDITALLKGVYKGLSEDCKEEFKKCVKQLAEEELYAKSNEEMNEIIKNQKEEFKKRLEKEFGDFIKGLFD